MFRILNLLDDDKMCMQRTKSSIGAYLYFYYWYVGYRRPQTMFWGEFESKQTTCLLLISIEDTLSFTKFFLLYCAMHNIKIEPEVTILLRSLITSIVGDNPHDLHTFSLQLLYEELD